MLILECSQGCYGRTDGRKDGSITISHRNFVGEGIIKDTMNKYIASMIQQQNRLFSKRMFCQDSDCLEEKQQIPIFVFGLS